MPPSQRPEFVLFDLDGTVWDSIPGIVGTLSHTLEAMDLPVPADEELAANIGPPLLEMLAYWGVEDHRLDEGRVIYRSKYAEWGEFACEVYPGAGDLLDRLRREDIRLATATSKGIDPTRRMLEHFELAHHFDVIAADPMIPREGGKAAVIADALDQLGTHPAKGMMVGDRHYDLNAGRQHGLTTVGVVWGYGSHEELRACEPDHIVADFEELAALVLG